MGRGLTCTRSAASVASMKDWLPEGFKGGLRLGLGLLTLALIDFLVRVRMQRKAERKATSCADDKLSCWRLDAEPPVHRY